MRSIPLHRSVALTIATPLAIMALALVALISPDHAKVAVAAGPGYIPNSALILGSTVLPGTATAGTALGGTDPRSLEEEQAVLAGFTVTVVPDLAWLAMLPTDFDNYQVIILGDPTCNSGPTGTPSYATALANKNIWEPVVMASGGNKYLTGSDDEYHHRFGAGNAQSTFLGGLGGAAKGVKAAITFSGAVSGATGAYVDLSCGSPGTALPLMDGLSSFGPAQFTKAPAPCTGSISLVADFPGLTGAVTGADLSGWFCSVHEFIASWPGDWVPLALATDPTVPVTYSATDIDTLATVSGSPYKLISGAGITVTSNLALTPPTATNPVGTNHTVTATLTQTPVGGGPPTPVAGATINFVITAGPNSGQTGSCVTNASGQCTFTYTDSGGVGTDSIAATTTVGGVTQSATATKTWVPRVDPSVVKIPDGDSENTDLGIPAANLWLCLGVGCTGAGEGDLRVVEHATNVHSDYDHDGILDNVDPCICTNPGPDGILGNADDTGALGPCPGIGCLTELGLGAYEFQVEYDNFVIQSVNPCDIVFGAGSLRGPVDEVGTLPGNAAKNADCGDDSGGNVNNQGTCTMSLVLENIIRFGCVTVSKSPLNFGPSGTMNLASLVLIPHPDLVNDIFPGNSNGVVTIIKDNGCELVDIFGHAVAGSINGGLTPVCGDLAVTVRILEGDLNLDCTVNLADEQLIASRYGGFFGSLLYSKWFDLEPATHDLDIDIKDLQKVFGRDGSTCQHPTPAQPPLGPPAPFAN